MAQLYVQALGKNIYLWGDSSSRPMTWENTLRAAPPSSVHPQGLMVLLPGQGGSEDVLENVITRPIYEADGSTIDEAPASSSWTTLPGTTFRGHTDNHVVRMKDGSFAALKAAFSWAPTPPGGGPWMQLCVKDNRKPYPVTKSGRGSLIVWRGSGAPNDWIQPGAIDVFKLAYQYPRPLNCDGGAEADLAKQCKTATKEWDLWGCAGLDRPEFYACPFTGYLYATAAYYSGPYQQHLFQHDHMLLCSVDKGVTWQVINDHLGGPAPHVMTSTPNGRLFVYCWTNDADNSYGHLLCSNLFDASKHELPVVDFVKGKTFTTGGDSQNGWQLLFGELYTADLIFGVTVNGKQLSYQPPDPRAWGNSQRIPTPAISRASTDVHSSRVRLSLWLLNEFSRVECAIVDIGVVDQVGGPHVEQGSLQLVDRISAADREHYSVLHGSFIDPDYIDTPPGFASNTSMFYWLEWPREPEVFEPVCAVNPSGDLHIVVREGDSAHLGHTLMMHDGSWPDHFGDATAAIPGPQLTGIMTAGACDADGTLHLLTVASNVLWHTTRQSSGGWPQPWENVQAKVPTHQPAQIYYPACACDQNKRLHVLVLDQNDTLYHSFRNPDGSWPFHFGNVADAVGDTSHGGFGSPACAADKAGNLHVLVVDHAHGKLWHTIRSGKDGSWLHKWGDVVANVPGRKPGRIARVRCALSADGELHIVANTDTSNELWHTIRDASGTWTTPWTVVQNAVPDPKRAPEVMAVSCAIDPSGVLHVVATDTTVTAEHLRYTYRKTDGTWPLNFVDPMYYVPPSSLFPNQMSAQYELIDGWPSKPVRRGPLSVSNGAERTWTSYDPGGDYQTGGFFYHNGLNYLPQWTEATGTYANLVHVVPLPIHPITPIPKP